MSFLVGRPWLRGIAGIAGVSSPMAALAQYGLPTAWSASRDDASTRRNGTFTHGQQVMRDAAAPMQAPLDSMPPIPYGRASENIVDTARRVRDWMREQNARTGASGAQSFDEAGFTMPSGASGVDETGMSGFPPPPPAPGAPPAPGIGPTDMGGYAPNQIPRMPAPRGPGVDLPRPAALEPQAPPPTPDIPWWLRNAYLQREGPGGAYLNPELAQRVLG